MQRRTVALFLSTVSLLAGTTACSKAPESGEQGGDSPTPQLSPQPGGSGGKPAAATPEAGSTPAGKPAHSEEGGEGGEGGEG